MLGTRRPLLVTKRRGLKVTRVKQVVGLMFKQRRIGKWFVRTDHQWIPLHAASPSSATSDDLGMTFSDIQLLLLREASFCSKTRTAKFVVSPTL